VTGSHTDSALRPRPDRRPAGARAIGPAPRWLRLAPRWFAAAAVLLACGGPPRKPGPDGVRASDPPAAGTDSRTPIEQRRDVACEQLGPKLTACAVEDARADLAAGKIQQSQFDADTAPAVQHKNTDEFLKACKTTRYSSRQVRVLEVCFRDEPRCAQLLDCLGHLNDAGTAEPRGGTKAPGH